MRAIGRASIAALVCVPLVWWGGAAGAGQRSPTAPPSASAVLYAVTLVTGDRVTVLKGADGRLTTGVQRGPGRDDVSFLKRGHGTDIEVLPSDALPLVQAGVVDRRLFEVSRLAAQGLDDAHTADVPLIVAAPNGFAPMARTVRSLAGFGTAVHAAKSDAGPVWRSVLAGTAAHVWLDGRSRVADADSNAQIGVPAARSRGLTGQGVTVAVLDTGVDATHPDLANVADSQDFTGSPGGAVDDNGHGTHVASILAGSGVASGGQYAGVAPGTRLIAGKVCDHNGNCDDSAVIAGMQWAAAQGARVVNLSLGTSFADGTDAVSVAVNQLTASAGTLFVCAAGNEGESFAVSSPAAADAALAVGSVNRQDQLSDFSSSGPRKGDDAVKPDLLAPGEDIVAARAAGTGIGTPVGTQYTTLSGTSMATPHVAGTAALLAQSHPDWRADRLKAALMGAADPLPNVSVFRGGAGRVDADRATAATVYPGVGSVSFGLQRFPYAGDPAATRTVSYANGGDAAVTLHIGLSTVDATGQPAPAGFLTVDSQTLTVPAHGTAALALTLNPKVATQSYTYSARVTATADGIAPVQVAVGAFLEPESYDVTVKVIDRDGKPAGGEQYVDVVDGLGDDHYVTLAGGSGTVRLQKTRFNVAAFVRTGTSHTVVYVPQQTLSHDVSLTLDARKGKRIGFSTDRSDAVPVDLLVEILPLNTFEGLDQSIVVPGKAAVYAVPVKGPTAGEFDFFLRAELASPARASNPYAYHLAYGWADQIPTTLTFAPHDSALGAVHTNYSGQGTAALGQRLLAGIPPPISAGGFGLFHELTLPSHLTDYYSAKPTTWQQLIQQRALGQTTQPMFDGSVIGPITGYAAAKTVTEDWNRAVLGPTLQTQDSVGNTVNRFADALTVVVWPWAPAEPRHSTDPFQETDYVTGSTTLAANGTVLASNPQSGLLDVFGMPAAKTAYTLTVVGDRRPGWSTLSPHVEVAWQFSSAFFDEFTTVYPALLTVRAAGAFDDLDRAPGGTGFPLTLTVETQKGATASAVRTVTVRYSTDDGKTWKSASVSGSGTSRKVTIPNPRTGFVSLKLSATDAAGDRVDQTVIRAYAVR